MLSHLINTFIEQSKDCFWIVDRDFKLLYANQQFQNMAGEMCQFNTQKEEVLFSSQTEVSKLEMWKANYKRAFNGETFEEREHFHDPAYNEVMYMLHSFTPIEDEQGHIFAVGCRSENVTEETKHRLATDQLLTSSLDVFCTLNQDGEFMYVSANSTARWGYTPDEMVGMHYKEFLIPEDVEPTLKAASEVIEGAQYNNFLNRYRTKSGEVAYNHWSVRWDNYSHLMYCVARDVQDQVKREELIQQSEQRFRALVQEGSDLIAILDPEGNYKYVSPTCVHILGVSHEDFLTRNAFEFIHPDDIDLCKAGLERLAHENRVVLSPYRFRNSEGEWRWLQSVLTNMSHIPSVNGIVANSRDITEERRLKELKRRISEMARIGSWEVDLNKNTVFWSDEVHLLHETDPETFTPTVEEAILFYRKDFRKLVSDSLDHAIETGENFDFEAVIVTSKRKEVWVRVIGNAEMADGKCVRIYGGFQDIDMIKSAENRLVSIAENLPGVIYQYHIHADGTDSIKYLSGDIEEVWGFDEETILNDVGVIWKQVEAGGQKEELEASFLESIQTGNQWIARIKYVKPNGELRTQMAYGTPSVLSDGTVMFNSIVLDITMEARNEELIDQVSQMARVGSWEKVLINPDQTEINWSKMVKEIFEVASDYTPKTVVGFDFYTPENRKLIENSIIELINSGTSFDHELQFKTAKGNFRWLRCIGKGEFIDGKCVKIYGSIQDIDKQKKSELERNSLQVTIENSLNEIYLFNADTLNFDYVNKGACKNLGYKPSELKHLTPLDLKPDYTMETFQELIAPLKNGSKEKILFFTYHRRKDASLYPVEVHLQLMKTKGNLQFLAIILDITERRKAEESILLANERFEKVTEATKDAIWDWDIVNDSFYRSEAIDQFFGNEPKKNMKELDFWNDSFHPEDLEEIKKSLHEAINDPNCKRWIQEYRVYNNKRETVYVVDQGVVIRDKNGKAVRMVGAMTDITEQKKMEIQLNELNRSLQIHTLELKRSNEDLEQFAFVASHDLQEPLRMVSSFMELLQRKYGDQLDEKAHQYIHFATDGAKRMKQIILDLLQYSRTNDPLEGKEQVNLEEIILDFKNLRRKLIAEKSAIINASDLPKVKTYKAAITQILHCLLDNALKYSREDVEPVVNLSVIEKESEWQFAIQDNGIGIQAEFFDKIFVIFKRLHNNNKYVGTGIGLPIAKRQVELLGGDIWLESTLGAGSTFYFTIPKHNP